MVDIDNVKAAYDAVSYLIKLGHRRIAHLAGPLYSDHRQKRLDGYQQALIDNNIPINRDYIVSIDPYTPNGYEAGIELFSKKIEHPSAVFCYNDLVAIGLINALSEMKIKVPEKVSVFGFDNIDFSEFVKIPLTTIQMPAYEIGNTAATLLIELIIESSSQVQKKIIVEHKLVERNSCTKYAE